MSKVNLQGQGHIVSASCTACCMLHGGLTMLTARNICKHRKSCNIRDVVVVVVVIGADPAGATGNFVLVLSKEPGNITFCPGIFQGPILIFEVKLH